MERGIDKVYLSGGTAKFKGIDKFFSENLGLEVNLWQSTKALEIDSGLDKALLESQDSLLSVAVGLALSKTE